MQRISVRRIAVDCLKCGHCGSLSEDALLQYGLPPDAPLATLTKRLTCKECGSRAVRAFRYMEDEEGPPLVPE
jgi:hypothetical protein